MSDFRHLTYKAGFEALYFSGTYRAFRPFTAGSGLIFMLHHVRPAQQRDFTPNDLLEVTPEYLERVIERVRSRGFDIVSMDEVGRRLRAGGTGRPFVAFTFDDGYRDNAEFAYPVLKKHNVPFAVYVATAFADHRGELWWLTLEEVIRRESQIEANVSGADTLFFCRTAAEKRETFDQLYWWMRSLPEHEMRAFVSDLAARHGINSGSICANLCMDWDELRDLAADPLVTIGAHTVNHFMLRKQPLDIARTEMAHSRSIIEATFDREVRHFAYPVGDPTSAGPQEFAIAADAGFDTAVTTRPGVLFKDHAEHMTALPRASLNGRYQTERYIDVLLSGAPFALVNGFRRVNAA